MSYAENRIYAKQIGEAAGGKTITRVIANQNPHSFVWFALDPGRAYSGADDAQFYADYLVGKTIRDTDARNGGYGNYVFLYIGDRILMFNSVAPLYHEKGSPVPRRHQLLLEFEDGSFLTLCGSLGGPIFLFQADPDGNPLHYTNSFPNLLSDAFSLEFFMEMIRATELRSLSAKAFLAAKNRIPGLDNGILHEILWEARVNPKTKMVFLTENDFISVYHAIKKVFAAVIERGGKDTDKDIYGNFGQYITHVSKNTAEKPCARCGGIVVKEAYLGGAVYYCPNCQPYIKQSISMEGAI